MRTTTVPAQITTVEDKIIGELNMTQLMLLVTPIFIGAGIFVILPPFFNYAVYKVVVIVCIAAIFAALAIRIKGRVVLHWLLILIRYSARPRYYLYNKNDTHMRDIPKPEAPQAAVKKAEPKKTHKVALPRLSTAELVQIERLITDPQTNLRFTTDKKGGLRVHLTEVR